jgi:signal transduction histidine kinase
MRLRPLLLDLALAAMLSLPAFFGTAALVVRRPKLLVVAALPLALLQTLPLGWRRVRPLAVLAITVVATIGLFAVDAIYFPIGVAVALYTVAAHRERRVALGAGLATVAALATPILLNSRLHPDRILADTVLLALAWTVGAYLGELRGRAARAEREQKAEARRAVAEEQARIARELHDVIAHSVSVMVVQAAAGGDVFDHSPARARQALAAIEATGRETLAELRHLLDTTPLEQVPAPQPGLGPQPGLAQLDALAGRVRGAGLAVELRVEGEPFPLPSGADLSAYRIVQEALTNTLKHAHASKASVLVRYRAGEVVLEVRDDGRGATVSGDGGGGRGRGIIGMRERAALYGGDLSACSTPGGGFTVRASIPIGAG